MEEQREKEIREAIEAGERALQSLRNAESQLSTARGLGIWDMLGGGIFATWMKHSKLEDAQQSMQQANWDLERFRKELEDVEVPLEIKVEVGKFLTFADFFFDGIVADIMVQNKIKEAGEQVQHAVYHVESIIKTLREVEKEKTIWDV